MSYIREKKNRYKSEKMNASMKGVGNMVKEDDFIEQKKKQREGDVAAELLNNMKVHGKGLRKAKRREPAFQKHLHEKLQADELYQSYLDGTWIKNEKYQKEYTAYIQKIQEKERWKREKERMAGEWKEWLQSTEFEQIFADAIQEAANEIVSCAKKKLKEEVHYMTAGFEYYADLEEEPLDEDNFEDFIRTFYSEWIPLSNFLDIPDVGYDNYDIEIASRMINSSPKLTAFNDILDIYDDIVDYQSIEEVDTEMDKRIREKLPVSKVLSLLEGNPKYKGMAEQAVKREEGKRIEEEKRRKKKERLKKEILQSIPKNITELYPVARMIKRHFILHIGPTNSGKTYTSLQALEKSGSGVYLAPLRLMAYETYEKLNEKGIPCSMMTGEEEILMPGSHTASMTIELLDLSKHYETAVIDEAQMISDIYRGGAWTNAVLGIAADKIHICMAPEAEGLICHLIKMCEGDTYEIHRYERKTPLVCDEEKFHFSVSVKKNDALIVFSKAKVIACAAELQKCGIRCSVIYGNLPYETRHNEVKKFVNGETDVVVSTDAIGMGMNIPIRRVAFLENDKFDGVTRRPLLPSEIQQIAGRAGRFGIFEKGYYNAEFGSRRIKKKIETAVPFFKQASIGFPTRLLSVEGKLTEILDEWKSIPLPPVFWKQNLKTMRTLAAYCELFTDEKELVYQLATTPVDDKNDVLVNIFKHIARDILEGKELNLSQYTKNRSWLYGTEKNLDKLEHDYKVYDLFYNLFRKFSDRKELPDILCKKKEISEKITSILASQALEPKKCKYCGKKLSWNYPYRMCQSCHTRMNPPRYRGYDDFWDDYDY